MVLITRKSTGSIITILQSKKEVKKVSFSINLRVAVFSKSGISDIKFTTRKALNKPKIEPFKKSLKLLEKFPYKFKSEIKYYQDIEKKLSASNEFISHSEIQKLIFDITDILLKNYQPSEALLAMKYLKDLKLRIKAYHLFAKYYSKDQNFDKAFSCVENYLKIKFHNFR